MKTQSVALDFGHTQYTEEALVLGVNALQAHPCLEAVLLRRERLLENNRTVSLVCPHHLLFSSNTLLQHKYYRHQEQKIQCMCSMHTCQEISPKWTFHPKRLQMISLWSGLLVTRFLYFVYT